MQDTNNRGYVILIIQFNKSSIIALDNKGYLNVNYATGVITLTDLGMELINFN